MVVQLKLVKNKAANIIATGINMQVFNIQIFKI